MFLQLPNLLFFSFLIIIFFSIKQSLLLYSDWLLSNLKYVWKKTSVHSNPFPVCRPPTAAAACLAFSLPHLFRDRASLLPGPCTGDRPVSGCTVTDILNILQHLANLKTTGSPIDCLPLKKLISNFYYSHSTITNQFCLEIIRCPVCISFDYLIYPYYPAYTG